MLSDDIYENEELLDTILKGKLPIDRNDLIKIVNTWGRYTDFFIGDTNFTIIHKQKPNGHLPLENLDISQIDDLSNVFYGSPFKGDLSKWDFNNVKKMNFTFCLSDLDNDSLKNLDFKNIISANYCFANSKFAGDISEWQNFENTNIEGMFSINGNFKNKYNNGNKLTDSNMYLKEWLNNNLDRIREINRPKDEIILDYFDFDYDITLNR